MQLRTIVSVGLGTLLLPAAVQAQGDRLVRGTVLNAEDGAALDGAMVRTLEAARSRGAYGKATLPSSPPLTVLTVFTVPQGPFTPAGISRLAQTACTCYTSPRVTGKCARVVTELGGPGVAGSFFYARWLSHLTQTRPARREAVPHHQ